MINAEKKLLRVKYKKLRSDINNRVLLDELITDSVLNSYEYKNADRIFAYWSVDSEVSTHKIINQALTDGKMVALPKCTDNSGNMQFYYIDSLSDLSVGMYGISEPTDKHVADDFTKVSLCLVPAISFDAQGYRLGYGKGYYDRFLSKFTGISMGLCYSVCISTELPKDEYDQKVDFIVSDKKIFYNR